MVGVVGLVGVGDGDGVGVNVGIGYPANHSIKEELKFAKRRRGICLYLAGYMPIPI